MGRKLILKLSASASVNWSLIELLGVLGKLIALSSVDGNGVIVPPSYI